MGTNGKWKVENCGAAGGDDIVGAEDHFGPRADVASAPTIIFNFQLLYYNPKDCNTPFRACLVGLVEGSLEDGVPSQSH